MSGLDNERVGDVNVASYRAADQAMWLGNADMINEWRRRKLLLRPIRAGTFAGSLLSRLRVPFSYMWSPSFVPKPADWPEYLQRESSPQSPGLARLAC
jgi:hypothetical protein